MGDASATDISQVLAYIGQAVRSADEAAFRERLELIPWDDINGLLDPDGVLAWLTVGLLELLYINTRCQWIEIILTRVEKDELAAIRDDPKLSIKTQIFLLPGISEELLQWLHLNRECPRYLDMLTEIKDWDGSEELQFYLDRMERVMNRYEASDFNYKVLRENILGQKCGQPWDMQNVNRSLLEWTARKAQTADLAVKNNFTDSWQLNDPDKSAMFHEQLEQGLNIINSITDQKSKLEKYRDWLSELEGNAELQLIYGPFNRLYQDPIHSVPGDLRNLIFELQPMYYSFINFSPSPLDRTPANVDDEEGFDHDWFPGYCFQCFKGLEDRTGALRLMLFAGSWYGCFCSWRCLTWTIEHNDGQSDSQYADYELIKVTAQRIQELTGMAQAVPEMQLNLEASVDADYLDLVSGGGPNIFS